MGVLDQLTRGIVEPRKKPARDKNGRLLPGHTANPTGLRKDARAFIERLSTEDREDVYQALLSLVREGNVVAVVRAWEYIAGKPKDRLEISQAPALPKLDYSKLTVEQLRELQRLMVLASPSAEKVIDVAPEKSAQQKVEE